MPAQQTVASETVTPEKDVQQIAPPQNVVLTESQSESQNFGVKCTTDACFQANFKSCTWATYIHTVAEESSGTKLQATYFETVRGLLKNEKCMIRREVLDFKSQYEGQSFNNDYKGKDMSCLIPLIEAENYWSFFSDLGKVATDCSGDLMDLMLMPNRGLKTGST